MADRKDQIRKLRARLDELTREPGPGRRAKGGVSDSDLRRIVQKQRTSARVRTPPEPVVYRRDLPRSTAPVQDMSPAVAHVALEEAVDGVAVTHAQGGTAFLSSTRVDFINGAESLSAAFEREMPRTNAVLRKRVAMELERDLSPADTIFMDIETTGLSTSPLFLIGIMVWVDGGFEVQQYLARTYAEERAVIAFFVDICARRKLLITFNGKSFDFPYIRTRAAANGVVFDLSPLHLDLLHESRRLWGRELPDCKLQTLESRVCGRVRSGDIPGAEIPEAYHAYVRTRNAWQIVEVLKHNMLDLVTLSDLMTRLPT